MAKIINFPKKLYTDAERRQLQIVHLTSAVCNAASEIHLQLYEEDLSDLIEMLDEILEART